MEDKNKDVIDLRVITQKIIQQRRKFYLPLGITFVLSCVYIFSQPRYYTSDASLAPEMESSLGAGGTLGSIASSFGIDLGDMQTSDAITPLLYPDLMNDNAFVCNLFNITVQTKDGELKTTYFDYLANHQKSPWWSGATSLLMNLFMSKEDDDVTNDSTSFNPYLLTNQQDEIVGKIQANITISVDKKTGVISLSVQDQDPLICKTMTDSVIVRLQNFITNYRTNKARTDVAYYTALVDSAHQEYVNAYMEHARYADANQHTVLESHRNKLTALENEMQLKYTSYSMLMAQLQAAQSKVQERTPAFTLLKGAALPIKPAGPKRMIFVAGMMMLVFFATALWIARKELHFGF